ncbi:4Fe-4S binding domain-containing protein [Desulfatibacillum alkenivorans DSM 16219]|jgi:ferredoxin|uniref:4Fe-4S binding domain-containing protein n=1 Tax=Desulfatibacillum alkenivorans DSM 16219 TaxID=1121393 RepID=A0A1M6I766_9BACT|nr:4Fe-4S binding protein [Desulfatibacillum alkenivorans]SHJ30246.1 4Fe-4S binding domain-containing protein [Desulfatibacillum alkenivorans DSM 16219]
MSKDIYQQLREQLDQYSLGFPATESGVEIKILKKMFTEEQAAMYLDMTLFLETPEGIAERAGMDPEKVSAVLQQMARDGLIFRHRKGDLVRYAAVPFVVGSYEFQLKNMDEEYARLCDQYMDEALLNFDQDADSPMRTIPVNQAVDGSFPVAAHDNAMEILKRQKKIAIAECICRVQQHKTGNMCTKPLEVCFVFGSHADYYVENGLARMIPLEEALQIQEKCEEYGLVNQPFNVVNPGGMCNCCGCCCGVLRALKKHPKPTEIVLTNFQAVVDAELCAACGDCEERCQVLAITYDDDGIAVVDEDRCIGCGLCITTCPTEALSLKPASEDQWKTPPSSEQELFASISAKRGTNLVPLKMAAK